MKILFVASECVPFAKVGGLGDVVGALPKALAAMGHDVRVLMPKYAQVDARAFKRLDVMLGVPLGYGPAWCGLYEGRLPKSDVPIYLLEHDSAYSGESIYGGEDKTVWGGVKFAVLSRGAFELCRWLDWYPDILHAHDWMTAWVPIMLNEVERDEVWQKTASVLTIHNIGHQPRFPEETLRHVGAGQMSFRPDGLEDHGEVNLLKGGLYHATMLTAVSPRYSRDIRTPEGGFGLAPVTGFRGADLVGILNGIDDEVWDPSTDPFLPARYSIDNMRGKAACKAELEARMGLDRETWGPIIGIVSRLSMQKGLDVVARTAERILATGARLVLLGSGEQNLQEHFQWLNQAYRSRVGVKIGYDEELAHLIEAGSDLFLMPSRFEPCGLNQMYSQRYGTLPIVHATGGLDDTVEQCDTLKRTGTGFKMYSLSEDALANTVRWAVEVYRHDPKLIEIMQRNGMKKRMGWDQSGARYLDVYKWALGRKGVVFEPTRK